jgi:hypothetical protein
MKRWSLIIFGCVGLLAMIPALIFIRNLYLWNLERYHGTYCGWTYIQRQDMLDMAVARHLQSQADEQFDQKMRQKYGPFYHAKLTRIEFLHVSDSPKNLLLKARMLRQTNKAGTRVWQLHPIRDWENFIRISNGYDRSIEVNGNWPRQYLPGCEIYNYLKVSGEIK